MSETNVEEAARKIAEMPRAELIALLRRIKCSFKLDFTDEFLIAQTTERLRHIALAAELHALRPSLGRR